jgi:hypothetical protein
MTEKKMGYLIYGDPRFEEAPHRARPHVEEQLGAAGFDEQRAATAPEGGDTGPRSQYGNREGFHVNYRI